MKRLKVIGSDDDVAVGKVLCIGRNYLEHIRELGNPVPEKPVLFLKPASSIIGDGGTVIIPDGIGEVHHEIELGVIIGTTCKCVPKDAVDDKILGYNVLLDMTARDIQAEAKKKGLPWTVAKGLDTFCPMSDIMPIDRVGDVEGLELVLKVNGEVRQKGSTAQMMRTVQEIVSYCSSLMTLERGDVLATGTPSGVGPVSRGDVLDATIVSVGSLSIKVG